MRGLKDKKTTLEDVVKLEQKSNEEKENGCATLEASTTTGKRKREPSLKVREMMEAIQNSSVYNSGTIINSGFQHYIIIH